jgi:hypothetical protein
MHPKFESDIQTLFTRTMYECTCLEETPNVASTERDETDEMDAEDGQPRLPATVGWPTWCRRLDWEILLRQTILFLGVLFNAFGRSLWCGARRPELRRRHDGSKRERTAGVDRGIKKQTNKITAGTRERQRMHAISDTDHKYFAIP